MVGLLPAFSFSWNFFNITQQSLPYVGEKISKSEYFIPEMLMHKWRLEDCLESF